MEAGGQDQRRLTDHGSEPQRRYQWPAWSPDGGKIAFVRKGSGGQELWVMNADGTQDRQLTSFGGPSWSRLTLHRPTWSPDGKIIAFQFNGLGSAVGYVNASRIMLLDVESGQLREVAQGYDPAWLPDGTGLVAGRASSLEDPSIDSWATGAGRLVWIDPNTGKVESLTGPARSRLYVPTPSPDGRFIAFFSDRDAPGTWPLKIWMMERTTGAIYLVWPYWPSYGGLTWSPDGGSLVFALTLWEVGGEWRPVRPPLPAGPPVGTPLPARFALAIIYLPTDLGAVTLAEDDFRVVALDASQPDWCCKRAGPSQR